MKTFFSLALLISLPMMAFSQVYVASTGGVNNFVYPTLKQAFDQINAGTHTGNIVIEVIGSITETAPAVLNAKDSGAANYTALLLKPIAGSSASINGNLAEPLIDLNGADNVTIDGLNEFVISNTSAANAASTIRFRSDASNNTITRCTVLGSTGAALSSGLGVIHFSFGSVTGNDNNTISNNNIGAAGSNLPINGIFSQGTSSAIDNSGISILNNSIYDFFNANGPSNGINANTGSSGWTISGNQFFQTGGRTYFTGSTHSGIFISGGSGYTINDNNIGGSAANTSGTAYTMTGTVATRFVGINVSASATSAATSIQGNRISNISLNTSSSASTGVGIFSGISVIAGNANIGTVSGNIIGAGSGTENIRTTSTTAGSLCTGIHIGSTGTIVIQNNTIGSITNSGTTATIGGNLNAISISSVAASINLSSNTIGNGDANNLRGGTLGLTTGGSVVTGINFVATPTTVFLANNTIQHLSAYGTGTSGSVRGITTATASSLSATGWVITNNTIANLTTNGTLTGLGSGITSAVGIHHLSSQGCLISNNRIHSISNINTTATTNIIVAGIVSANAAVSTTLGTTISQNRIWGLNNTTIGTTALTPPIVTGIAIRSGNNTTDIINNMISIGEGVTSSASFIGIWANNGSAPGPTSINIYHNSVRVSGTASSGSLPSFAFLRSQYLTTTSNTIPVDIRNNIFQNGRTGGTGAHYAISNGFNATTVSPLGWPANASNFNAYSANFNTIGHWTNAVTFDGWKTASASDNESYSGMALPFVNPAIADLHVNFGLGATVIESGGTQIPGVVIDFDGEGRPGPVGSVNGGAISPDIGADEFDGVRLDILPPTISLTPLGFTCDGAAPRTFVATITDASGVPTTGPGRPVLYWRVNTGAYTAAPATHIAGNFFQFTISATANQGDVVSYFIVAQDNSPTPNVGAFPSAGVGGLSANPPSFIIPPSSPLSYSITSLFPSGTYTVGTGGTYPTLTAAINDYNTRCILGPIVFELLDNNYAEAGSMTILKHPNENSVNRLTIRPAAGVNATISATAANSSVLRILNGFVTIDGSNNGTNTRNLTITNNSVTAPAVVYFGSVGTSPNSGGIIQNCTLINGVNTSSALIVGDAVAVGAPGYFDNIRILNNDIRRAFSGIFVNAVTTPENGANLQIENNVMSSSGADAIRRTGIYVQGVDGATINNNTIGNFESATAESKIGIWLATGSKNIQVSRNQISNIGHNGTGTGGAGLGINVTCGEANANITISNNQISNLFSSTGANGVSTNGIAVTSAASNITLTQNTITQIKNTSTSGWGANGILLGSSTTTGTINVSNNYIKSVWGYGFAGASSDDNGYGIAVISGAGYQINHNTVVLDSNQVVAGGLPAALIVTSGVNTTGAINLRNNLLINNQTAGSTQRYAIYSTTPNSIFGSMDHNNYVSQTGPNLGFIGSNQTNLAALQTAFGSNTNSLSIAPVFVSSTNLRLKPDANEGLDDKGTPIASVTTDHDGQSRNATTPDIGADEFTYMGTCPTANVKFPANLTGASYQWQVDNGSGFVNLTNNAVYVGANTDTLFLNAPPSNINGFRFRCLVDGSTFSQVYTYKVGTIWTGTVNSNWTEAGNWSCGVVPDQFTDVLIDQGTPNSPLVNANVQIRSLRVTPGASVTVGSGFDLKTLQN